MSELRLTRRARRDLEALPRETQSAVIEVLVEIEANPRELGKELLGALRGLWSARVGNYRVLYTLEKRDAVIVRAIRHRASAYRGRP